MITEDEYMLGQFNILLPELCLISGAFLFQLLSSFCNKYTKIIYIIAVIFCAILAIVMMQSFQMSGIGFINSFQITPILIMAKSFILICSTASLAIYYHFCNIAKLKLKIEFVTLLFLSVVGIFVAISARNFLLLFVALELQALTGYALSAFNTNNSKSSEAAVKYFTLGGLFSCIGLLGISFIYGFTGTIEFHSINIVMQEGNFTFGIVIGFVLMLSMIFFKLSAAPFHFWTPDVYEGAPIYSVSYFATSQKFGALIVLLNLIYFVIGDYELITSNLIKDMAILSILVGAIGAIRQKSIKRLLGYSSILSIGYVLMGVSLNTQGGYNAAVLYLLIYAITILGFFACLVALLGQKSNDATFQDIKGVLSERKAIAAAIIIIMFSLIGIPPLAGFFGKYYIFYHAILSGEYILTIIALCGSIVSAYYYLKIIKYMCFIEPSEPINIISTQKALLFITITTISFILFFCIFIFNN
ncbi:MAG: NADH-quinone oxidoreductase subunit N [Rickettsiaceae bacterium]